MRAVLMNELIDSALTRLARHPTQPDPAPGALVAMWLCSPHRLGRVGTLKWSSFATAAAVVLLATTLKVQGLFAVMSIFTLFVVGKWFEQGGRDTEEERRWGQGRCKACLFSYFALGSTWERPSGI